MIFLCTLKFKANLPASSAEIVNNLVLHHAIASSGWKASFWRCRHAVYMNVKLLLRYSISKNSLQMRFSNNRLQFAHVPIHPPASGYFHCLSSVYRHPSAPGTEVRNWTTCHKHRQHLKNENEIVCFLAEGSACGYLKEKKKEGGKKSLLLSSKAFDKLRITRRRQFGKSYTTPIKKTCIRNCWKVIAQVPVSL